EREPRERAPERGARACRPRGAEAPQDRDRRRERREADRAEGGLTPPIQVRSLRERRPASPAVFFCVLHERRAPFDTRPCGPGAQGEVTLADGITESASS